MRRAFLPSILLLILPAAAWADIPPGPGEQRHPYPWGYGAPPRGWFDAHPPAPRPIAPLVVEAVSDDDRQTRLRLPGSLVKQLTAGAGTSENAPVGWAPTPTGTVVAGLAMSVALVLGGMWIIRRPKRRWIPAGVTAAAVAVMVGVAGCPWRQEQFTTYVERLPPMEIQEDGALAGKALLEVGDGDDAQGIQLTIDKDGLAVWAAQIKPDAAPK